MAVMIGVDPHKGSHTAVAIDDSEVSLGELRVRAVAAQVEAAAGLGGALAGADLGGRGRGRVWATCWPSSWSPRASGCWTCNPSWAPGCGCWRRGRRNKNDPNDARSVAVAALRSTGLRLVVAEDHAAVMKVWAKRHRDLGRRAPRWRAGCTRCCANWSPAASPRTSPQVRPLRSSTLSSLSGAVAAGPP